MRLTPVSWGPNGDPDSDHLINDGDNYEAVFRTRSGGEYIHSPRAVASVKTERPGKSPVHAYAQPQSRPLFLWIRLLPSSATVETPGDSDVTLALVDQLQSWFSETAGQQWLVAEDASGQLRRIRAIRTAMEPDTDWTRWNIQLESDYGLWESVIQEGMEYDGVVVSEAEPTFEIQGSGSMPAWPIVTITPTTVKAAVNSPRYRRRLISTNRVPRPVDTPSVGWPSDVTGGGIDTATLEGAGKLLSNFDDLRVVLAGQEKDRWLSEGSPSATTRVWANWSWRSGRSVTLSDGIDADDTALRVSDFNGFGGWEEFGAIRFGNEVMLYQRDPSSLYEIALVRGARNTTASPHSAGAIGRWVEHPFADLLYGYSNAGAAPAPLTRKPVIDLAASTNLTWRWTGPYFNHDDLRTGTFSRMYTSDNPGSPFLRCYESDGLVYIDNSYPEAEKPRANNFYIDIPVGLRTSGVSLEFTSVEAGDIPVEGWGWRKHVTARTYHFNQIQNLPINTIEYYPAGPENPPSSFSWYSYNVEDDGSEEISNEGPWQVGLGVESTTLVHRSYFVGFNVVVRTHPGTDHEYLDITQDFERFVKQEFTISFTEEIGIREHDHLTAKEYLTDKESYESAVSRPESSSNNVLVPRSFSYARDVFRIRFNAEIVIGVDKEGEQFDNIPDGAKDTGAFYARGPIQMYFNPNNTPEWLLCPEEEVYVIDGRLLNETTGEYIDLLFPCAIGESLTIDTKNHRIIDSETGWEVSFAMRGGGWPTIRERVVNQWRWIEEDAEGLNIAFEWRKEWN